MLKGLLQFVLSVVTCIANILFTPIFEALNSEYLGFGQFINAINTILNMALEGAVFTVKFLCIPTEALVFFFGFLIGYALTMTTMRAIKLVYNIYHKLKPT